MNKRILAGLALLLGISARFLGAAPIVYKIGSPEDENEFGMLMVCSDPTNKPEAALKDNQGFPWYKAKVEELTEDYGVENISTSPIGTAVLKADGGRKVRYCKLYVVTDEPGEEEE